MFVTIVTTTIATAQSQEKIYSLLLINIAKGVAWPENDVSENFVISVLGYPPLAGELTNTVTNTRIHGKKMIIRQINDVAESSGAHILFLPAFKSKALPQVVERTSAETTLIVCNFSGAAQTGAAINFLLVGGKVTFEINAKSIEKKGLKISSSLKNSGRIVD
jgi:hypothetical protein